MPSLRSVLVLLSLFLGGCLPAYEWYRPGVDPLEARADLNHCSRSAEFESYSYRPHFYYGRSPVYYIGPNCGHRCARKRAAADEHFYRSRIEHEASVRAGRLTDFCMRSKGYALRELAPVQ